MSSTPALTVPPPAPSALTRWQRRVVTADFIVLVITGLASIRGLLTLLGSDVTAVQGLGGIILFGNRNGDSTHIVGSFHLLRAMLPCDPPNVCAEPRRSQSNGL
jgi:hypothetical protein